MIRARNRRTGLVKCEELVGIAIQQAALVGLLAHALHAQVCTVSFVSADAAGTQALVPAEVPCVSPDGRLVSFATAASLLPQDVNGNYDVYLADTVTGALEMVSVGNGGVLGNDQAGPRISFSSDGRYVAFLDKSTNLAPGVGGWCAYVRDRQLGMTQLAGVNTSGVIGLLIDTNVAISGDGRCVVFSSVTSALVPGPDPNGSGFSGWDVYLKDMQSGAVELVSVNLSGATGNYSSGGFERLDVSADARYVVFASGASDLVTGDSNSALDVFRRDRTSGTTELVSIGLGGQPSNGHSGWPSCSANGRFVAFISVASNLVSGDTNSAFDVFVRDMASGVTSRASVSSTGLEGDAISHFPTISGDARFIAFGSEATNLVPNDLNGVEDVFLHDRVMHRTERSSLTASGFETWQPSVFPTLSRDAATIAFQSLGVLAAADINGTWDAYARQCPMPVTYCTPKINSLGCVPSMTSAGVPLASWPNGYVLGARSVLNQKTGMLLYSTQAASGAPFAGGTLCIHPPVHRTPMQNSGGTSTGLDCTGAYAFDFNTRVYSGVDPSLVAGTHVWTQYWSRDPGFSPLDSIGLTDGVEFVIAP